MLKSAYTFFVCSTLFLIGVLLFLAPLHPARPHSVNGVENHNVNIPDSVLRTAIEEWLFKDPGDPITADEMKTVTEISTFQEDIGELTGLEHAINLTFLDLPWPTRSRTEIEALNPLDLEPLRGLTKLKDLTLTYVRISSMAPLLNLTELKHLNIQRTYSIPEIPNLSKLTKLIHLRLRSNAITNIAGIGGLTDLKHLDLIGNWNLSDISPLTQLRNLEILRLDNAAITRESLSAVLPSLSPNIDPTTTIDPDFAINSGQLGFGNTNISDLSVLDRLPNVFLYALHLSSMGTRSSGTLYFHLTDLTPLVDLMNKGKVINSETSINLWNNFGLDYESLYEDLPALIAGSRDVKYETPDPLLEREFPKEEFYRGRPRARYTFTVRAVNNTTISSVTYQNLGFEKVPVTFTVTAPDGTETETQALTGPDGLASVSFRLGTHGETHTVDAVVPAKTTSVTDLAHPELRVSFTVTADSTVPPPRGTGNPDGLTVTFLDYPQENPIDEFSLTIKFSEPVIGFEKKDITLQTKLTTGKGIATLTTLTPETPIHADSPAPDPIQTYTATVELPADATGLVRLIVRKDAAITPPTAIVEKIGPSSDTASDLIDFGPALDEDVHFRHPPALVVTKIDFTKGMFWIQNTTQYRFNVEMRIYSEDHKDRWFRISERDLITIEDAETLTFSLTPVEIDDASIIHLNSERLLNQNQNQPLKLSAEKFCIKLMRVIPVDIASNMNEDFRVKETRWDTPGDVIYRQYDASWDVKLKGLRRDHLAYYRFPLDGQLSDSWDVEASVAAAPSVSRVQSEVVLSAFRSASTASGVLVEWTTASERANAGFYVLRSRNSKSGFVRVSPRLIVGTGTATEGQTYSWRDTTAAVNVPYYYRLEEVSLYGKRRALATVRLRGFISSTGKVLYKWADVKTFEKGW